MRCDHIAMESTGVYWKRATLVGVSRRNEITTSQQLFRRLAARRGNKRATTADGHGILVIAFHLLKRKENLELGGNLLRRMNA
jgi:hypothetical protein